MKKGKVLLVDDEEIILKAFELSLRGDYDIQSTTSIQEAKEILHLIDFDVVVVDLNFEGQEENGLNLIDHIVRVRPLTSIVVLSGDNSTARVSDAMRRPIIDFVVKGEDIDEKLRLALERGIQQRRGRKKSLGLFQTRSPEMQKVLHLLERITQSGSQSPILIIGEPGTGKEHTARHIGALTAKQVVTTNMANHSKDLADSALFGHVKGAFTGADSNRVGLVEQANNGILFLDEIGETPLEVQAKLLRVVQEKEFTMVGSPLVRKVNLRFVAATNRDLHEMAGDGLFRKDLLERLSTWTIRIPALRDRPEDIEFLTNEFLNAFASKERPFQITPDGLDELLEHPWPGNIRELRNVIERITTAWENRVLDRAAVRFGIDHGRIAEPEQKPVESSNDERSRYLVALRSARGNRSEAAKLLNVHRTTFVRNLRKWNIQDEIPHSMGRPKPESGIA